MTTKNDLVIRETKHNLYRLNQADVVIKMSTARIKDAAASCLESASGLINQEFQDESTGESTGYLTRLATVKVFWSLANKDQSS